MSEPKTPIIITNCTGRPTYCEDCGARMEPGKSHVCPGPEPDSEPEVTDGN